MANRLSTGCGGRTSSDLRRPLFLLLGFVGVFGLVSPAGSATVEQVHLSEMLSRCELIFEGRVVGHSTEEIASGFRTWVEFEVVEVVKGPHVGRTFSLAFLGGQLNGLVDRVAGLRVPEVGEHGIYFVESLQRFQVNPLFGWDQGRLRILIGADGRERVVSARGRPVVGLRPERLGAKRHAIGTGSGPAEGVQVDEAASLEGALTKASVKAALVRALLSSPGGDVGK